MPGDLEDKTGLSFGAGVLLGMVIMLAISVAADWAKLASCRDDVQKACVAKCGDSYACRTKCELLADNLVECE